jgi:Cu2+-exporting ATPase
MTEPTQIACDHCGLPVPTGLVESSSELQFCCSGCELASEVIHDHGLEDYYDLRSRLESPRQAIRTARRDYMSFDDSSFTDLYVTTLATGQRQTELYLESVHCAACVWLVEKTPVVVPGVAEVRLDLGRRLATVSWDPEVVCLSSIASFLHSIGYPAHPFRGVEQRNLARREDRRALIQIGVAGLLAGNVMLLSFALYGGLFHGIEPKYETLFRWTSLILSIPSVAWCAAPFFRGAFGALKTRTLHMDLPIVIGIVAALLQGSVNTVFGRGEVYFDTLTALIFLLLVGRFLQQRQQRAAASATELLFALTPSTAHLEREDGTIDVPIEALRKNQIIRVLTGETVPADGIVIDGRSEIDRSLLTGESRPEAVGPGDTVEAGIVNLSGALTVSILTTGEATRVGKLMHLIESAARHRAPAVLLANRLSGWFVATVIWLATLTCLVWLKIDPQYAVSNAVALLIVTCPCALGLATPLAVSSAIGQAARAGILIKGGEPLELLARTGRMFIDKTGTLTEGRLTLVEWVGNDSIKDLVAALESHSSHPVARALTAALPTPAGRHVENVQETTGAGIAGSIDGRKVIVASPSHIEASIGALPLHIGDALHSVTQRGLTPIVVAVEGKAVAVTGLGDPMRPETPAALRTAGERGWQIEIISGDHPAIVENLVRELNFESIAGRGGISPEEKIDRVRDASREGNTVMIGDGVNDAAALAAASIGIAVEGGAEAALNAADIYLQSPGIGRLSLLLDGARKTRRVIKRNLALSLLYNIVAASLAVSCHVAPLLAAILMPTSSLTVVLSSYRSRMFDARLPTAQPEKRSEE